MPDHRPGLPYTFMFTGLGSRLYSYDIDGDGYKDLVIGSPYRSSSNYVPQTGIVHALLSSSSKYGRLPFGFALDVSEVASWSLSDGSIMYEQFGSSVAFHGDLLVVGAPGWRAGRSDAARGRVYAYNVTGSDTPSLLFSITANEVMTGFGKYVLNFFWTFYI
jgi:glycosylphosphatidylinositol phospholipase D